MFRTILKTGSPVLAVAALVAIASVANAQPSTCNGRSLSNGGTIVPSNAGGTVAGSVSASQGVYYTVTASAAASYTFTFCSNGGTANYDTWLCLYNSAGALLTQVDDSCGLLSQIIQQLSAGTYYIAVSGFSSSSGSYTLAYIAPGVIPNLAPDAPTALIQSAVSNGPARNPGFVSDATLFVRANVTDQDAGDLVGVQVEVLPAAAPFDPNNVTGQTAQTPAAGLVASGQTAEAVFTFTGAPFGSGDYHWRLRGIDGDGATGPWVVFNPANVHVTVDLDPPTAPIGPYTPSEGSGAGVTPPAGDVTFLWGPATDVGPPGPMSFRIQVSTTPGMNPPLVDTVVNTTEHTAPFAIAPTPYFWRVAAIDQAGNQGPFIPAISFIVKFQDDINHGGGDCAISAGASAGPLVPSVLAALVLAYGWRRRRSR